MTFRSNRRRLSRCPVSADLQYLIYVLRNFGSKCDQMVSCGLKTSTLISAAFLMFSDPWLVEFIYSNILNKRPPGTVY